jgi:hypothetical protein
MDRKEKEEGFRINWETFKDSPQEREAWLRKELTIQDQMLDALGGAGQEFKRLFNSLNLKEEVDLTRDSPAAYMVFRWQEGFVNKILFGKDALVSRRYFFLCRFHEMIHALQHNEVAATHAQALNQKSKIFLCPRDALWMSELLEKDAYAKQYLIDAYMTAGDLKDFSSALHKNGVQISPAMTFPEDLMKNLTATGMKYANMLIELENQERLGPQEKMIPTEIIKKVITQAGTDALSHKLEKRRFGFKETLKSAYNRDELTHRKTVSLLRRQIVKEEAIYVRLEPEDIRAFGNTLGNIYNPFTDGKGDLLPEYIRPSPLSWRNRLRLKFLNASLGIKNEDTLPTFGEALKARNMTRESFLTMSRQKTPQAALPPPENPAKPLDSGVKPP